MKPKNLLDLEDRLDVIPTMKLPPPTEHTETVTVSRFLDILVAQKRVIVYSKTSQETFTKSWGTKIRNKQEGVRPGLPDFIIVTPTSVLFLELKRIKLGHVRDEQKVWLTALEGKQTHSTVCFGSDNAMKWITEQLNLQ